jgi:hypothetical protein
MLTLLALETTNVSANLVSFAFLLYIVADDEVTYSEDSLFDIIRRVESDMRIAVSFVRCQMWRVGKVRRGYVCDKMMTAPQPLAWRSGLRELSASPLSLIIHRHDPVQCLRGDDTTNNDQGEEELEESTNPPNRQCSSSSDRKSPRGWTTSRSDMETSEDEVSGDAIADLVLKTYDALPRKAWPQDRGEGKKEWVPLSGIVARSLTLQSQEAETRLTMQIGNGSLICLALGFVDPSILLSLYRS